MERWRNPSAIIFLSVVARWVAAHCLLLAKLRYTQSYQTVLALPDLEGFPQSDNG